MKTILRILFVVAGIMLFSMYSSYQDKNSEKIMNEEGTLQSLESEEQLVPEIIEEGVMKLIGEPKEKLLEQFGEPIRKDLSSYGYTWWIYPISNESYFQAGVKDDKIVTLFAIGKGINVKPYTLGQNLQDIYAITPLQSEITVVNNNGNYKFELSEQDMNQKALRKNNDDTYAQLYLDRFTGTLMGIRYLDSEILILQHPYQVVYTGEKINDIKPSSSEWELIEEGNENQIIDMTNIIRKVYDKPALSWNEEVAEVARGHSTDMFKENYFSHESPTYGTLGDRLDKAAILYLSAGENIAAQYTDGADAVMGWLNSPGHREALLDEEFTHLGVGVHEKYYTQNFVKFR
ncbi:hypothetical protein Q73_04945 [Bacillus coahuilensis m2-6]|uniref:CAP domain-containing protein n=1 Tax=Bacillus coahuilensis TaxID=408580 RepID=UPI00079252D2|nr:CAP domain-containing protein [Bacillus coahuilensis]KUP08544.1 hypothetical protein Q73_04945 [Bacillus coahuilensis m2-6]